MNSINSGAVPNIQSAWTYICQNECQKAIETSTALFLQNLHKINLPCDETELQAKLKDIKSVACQHFKSKVMGMDRKGPKQALNKKLEQVVS